MIPKIDVCDTKGESGLAILRRGRADFFTLARAELPAATAAETTIAAKVTIDIMSIGRRELEGVATRRIGEDR